MGFSDYVTSVIRTVVPVIVGSGITALGRALGVELDTAAAINLAVVVTTSAWYALARWLEGKDARFGWLLGSPKAPTY